ncbi:vacuolar ATPase assembly integral membrane protein Vph2p [[Candida] railenensis]|uniref:Vacuolar ATPase assembly integral membrane protein Vph2p n=1 Tax=[Candida] railenensis TaxID=45579 RepID=A0A9P0QPN4_9ASCO|nr:vacuolar ATPase assembly integral membrane protein Vph2p [[Candida] railenensis]
MTKFLLTPQLTKLVSNSSLDESQKESLLSSPYITHANLISFYKLCSPTPTLLQLIQMTKLYIPVRKEESKPKSKEFIESMNELRLKAKEDEYQKLIGKTTDLSQLLYEPSANDIELTPAQMHKEVRSHITTIFNIFISVASVVYAIWYWTGSSMRIKDSYRILLCIFFGLLILVAEVVVYMGYLNKIEEAKIAENKKKEVKKVIKTI